MSDYISKFDPLLIRRLITVTQAGIPLVEDPWEWLGAQLEISANEALDLVQALQKSGAIRRVAAVPNHYRLGFKHNGMTVWDVDDVALEQLGPQVGALPFVSHCYKRPRRHGWPYNLFAMVHGREAAEIEEKRQQIRDLLGPALNADEMLVSRRILKKTGLRIRPGGTDHAQD